MPIDRSVIVALAMLLAACTAPAPTDKAPDATGNPPTVSDAPAEPRPLPVETGNGSEVAVETLPADVREYILKQRMCRHFRSGVGNPALADALCAGGDAATWKALIRKYEGEDIIGSVLLAEKPFDATP